MKLRVIKTVGRNVLQYNVTLPWRYVYPKFVTSVLIENGWEVKVRYRNVDHTPDGPWTYIKCEFPEGTGTLSRTAGRRIRACKSFWIYCMRIHADLERELNGEKVPWHNCVQ